MLGSVLENVLRGVLGSVFSVYLCLESSLGSV